MIPRRWIATCSFIIIRILPRPRVDIPVYDFTTHKRTIEGRAGGTDDLCRRRRALSLYWDEVRALLRTQVFVDCPHSVCLERRLAQGRLGAADGREKK